MQDVSIGIILAGGIGSRFQGKKPKQYYCINGKEMISYSVEAFRKAKRINDFIVVLDREEYEAGRVRDTYHVRTICGGRTRNHSLKNALDYIQKHYPNCQKVIENNAACPMTSAEIIDRYLELLDDYDYVQTTFKITDALGSYKCKNVDREDFFLIQAPDAYRYPLLYKYFDPEYPNGHPAVQLPEAAVGYNYFEYGPNFKVTAPEDLEIAETLLKRREDRGRKGVGTDGFNT